MRLATARINAYSTSSSTKLDDHKECQLRLVHAEAQRIVVINLIRGHRYQHHYHQVCSSTHWSMTQYHTILAQTPVLHLCNYSRDKTTFILLKEEEAQIYAIFGGGDDPHRTHLQNQIGTPDNFGRGIERYPKS